MKVAVIGTGYVGLTTAVALAYLGHEVWGVDVDATKIRDLARGHPPIHEPGLEALLPLVQPRLHFTTAYADAIPGAEVILIAVGTPPGADGAPDLRYVRQAVEALALHLDGAHPVVAIKSTVPMGTGRWVRARIQEIRAEAYEVASNPEFLRQGSALHDTFYPNRIVIGADTPRAVAVLEALYRPLLEQSFPPPKGLPRPSGLEAVPLVATDLTSAELIKYAANAFLALKISFINEIAALAEQVGADATHVARGIGLDARIGPQFLRPGIGWGGSCFDKDTAALLALGRAHGTEMRIVQAARAVNHHQRERIIEKLTRELTTLRGRTVGLLGIAFKPHTDDLRDAPALAIAHRLIQCGAHVRLHDPVALARARREHPELERAYREHPTEVFEEADAVVLVTEWPQYLELPWETLAPRMRFPLVLDGRNVLDAARLTAAGFRYLGTGRCIAHTAPAPTPPR
ncbi:UDP-glucose dehydrogenase family protein [Marinithermus hydrothermalis]|uniref:UDP-glucose 6-dehydrogenase n=1 Tax=Marinithermus hydrothermalis (strain DSM 14884 / JCM 11576 / T1) TaxID=869210 RepID=F2NKE2_MARHT|nr:UDP-glucose/GDP-mannose dehydrogenase family protein [Marinithermus hydrothermalis]AEB12391.1 nucleotide sugar dehydrogenase [Marinithermus hydrothermalis DSM 14884]